MEEQKFTLVLTNQQLDVVYRSLLEIPAKFSLPVIQEIERQIREQQVKEPEVKERQIKEKPVLKK